MKRRDLLAAFSAAAAVRPSLAGAWSPSAQGGVYDVTTYGAKGDGATDDRPAVQAAITAAENAGGGIVYFPPGGYLCSYAGVHDTGSLGIGARPYALILGSTGKLCFKGAGRGLSVLKKTTLGGRNADYNLFITRAVSGYSVRFLTFEDLTLDGGQSSPSAPFASGDEHLFFAARLQRCVINRCEFRSARGGGLYVWQGTQVHFEGCHFELLDRAGVNNAITLIGSNYGAEPWWGAHVVRDCTFVNNGQIGIGIGGYKGAGPLKDVLVSGCTFFTDGSVVRGLGAGLAIEMVSVVPANPLERVTIENCSAYGGRGLGVQGNDISVRGCVFRNMDAAPYGQALLFNNPGNTQRVTLQDVVVDTTTDEAIVVGALGGGEGRVRLVNVAVYKAGKEGITQTPSAWGQQALEGAQFIACQAVDCGRDGISIASRDVHFTDCVATGNGRSADTFCGLRIQGGAERTVVIGGRYGAAGEARQRYGIDDGGSQTQILGAQTAGRLAAVKAPGG